MKPGFIVSVITLFAILASSCEGVMTIKGSVYDHDTHQPVSGVQAIFILNAKDTMINCQDDPTGVSDSSAACYTDSEGRFAATSGLIGMVLPNKYALLFIKSGYDTLLFHVSDKHHTDSIVMTKRNQ